MPNLCKKKSIFFKIILAQVQERMDIAKASMDEIQAAANNETKSSAGDKYETSRAMGQINKDMYARQFYSASNEWQVLQRINIDMHFKEAFPGAIVETEIGFFFISISAGKISTDGCQMIAVSPQSPIGKALYGKKMGDQFLFNNKMIAIKNVC